MTALALHTEYDSLVAEFAAQVLLSQAELAANPHVDSEAFEHSVAVADRIYEGLNELASNLELLIEQIPGGGTDAHWMEEDQLDQLDRQASRVMQWQQKIEQVKRKVFHYSQGTVEPHEAAPILAALRELPRSPTV